jgi:hypothetical protein
MISGVSVLSWASALRVWRRGRDFDWDSPPRSRLLLSRYIEGAHAGRADGYIASEIFFFGINTGIRLGFAPGNGTELRNPVSRAFPSWNWSILTENYLCRACSYHEIEDGNARAGDGQARGQRRRQAWAERRARGAAGGARSLGLRQRIHGGPVPVRHPLRVAEPAVSRLLPDLGEPQPTRALCSRGSLRTPRVVWLPCTFTVAGVLALSARSPVTVCVSGAAAPGPTDSQTCSCTRVSGTAVW